MKQSQEIYSYGEYITGHLIYLIDYINDNTNLNKDECDNISKEIETIAKSINEIYSLLEQYNYEIKKYPTTHIQEITKNKKIHLIRDIKINTIITDK